MTEGNPHLQKALKRLFTEFVLLIKKIDLIEGSLVAVDGAFLRANASKNTLIMKKGAKAQLKKIEDEIEHYLTLLDATDAQDQADTSRNITLPCDIDKLKEKKAKLEQELKLLEEKGVEQYNRTDPDATLMSR
jgi:ribosome biogenesis GTPase A